MPPPTKAILLTKTSSYHHTSIPATIKAISSIPWLSVHATRDSSELISLLSDTDVLILAHTTGPFLDDAGSAAVRSFVNAGGNVVGIHAATAAMDGQAWYGEMLGASFDGHPEPQWGIVTINDAEHFITQSLALPRSSSHAPSSAGPRPASSLSSPSLRTFLWFDEFYNFRFPVETSSKCHVLLSVEESSYSGGKHGTDHPLAWCRETDGGRIFYTSLGHFDEAYQDDWYMGMLERGVQWAALGNDF